jgi:hypothetical protein
VMGGAPLQACVRRAVPPEPGAAAVSCHNATYAVQQGFGSYFGLN